MILKTTNGETYRVKWVEFWNETERCFIAETYDGDEIKLDEGEFDKIEEDK